MSPLVNTDVKMPKAMFEALGIYETICVVSKVNSVTTEQVKQFLEQRYGKKLADQFKPEYLFSSPGV